MTTPIYGYTKPTVGGSTGTWGTSLNTDLDNLDTHIGRPRVQRAAVTWGATPSINLSNGVAFTATNSEAAAPTFDNCPAGTFMVAFLLLLTNGGAYTITWPASVDWAGGTAPTLTAAGKDVLRFVTFDGGTTWLGSLLDLDSK